MVELEVDIGKSESITSPQWHHHGNPEPRGPTSPFGLIVEVAISLFPHVVWALKHMYTLLRLPCLEVLNGYSYE
jgi:hypothetical protein